MTDMFLLPLSPETEAGAIVALNRETEGNGLRLTHAQAEQLVEVRAQSLRRTGRIEFAPGRVERIIRAFCDSPYLSQEDYADALSALIELFDAVKTETDDRISDEALIEEMRAAFDGVCHGSLELLADEVLSRVVRRVNARGGMEWKMTEDV